MGLPRKFSHTEVLEIREAYGIERVTIAELARAYGVSRRTIQRMLSGETYAECPGPLFPEGADTGRRMQAPPPPQQHWRQS